MDTPSAAVPGSWPHGLPTVPSSSLSDPATTSSRSVDRRRGTRAVIEPNADTPHTIYLIGDAAQVSTESVAMGGRRHSGFLSGECLACLVLSCLAASGDRWGAVLAHGYGVRSGAGDA